MQRSLTFLMVIALVACFTISLAAKFDGKVKIIEEDIQCTWITSSSLNVTIPIEYVSGGEALADIAVSVVDADEKVLAKVQKEITVGKKRFTYRATLKLKGNQNDDAKLRFKYSYSSKNQDLVGYISLAKLRPRLDLRILGQNNLISNSTASIRLMVSRNLDPVEASQVKLILTHDNKEHQLWLGSTNKAGSVSPEFKIPDLKGEAQLKIVAEYKGMFAEAIVPVSVDTPVRIMLTTDKPIYQPGQQIHIRSLSLLKANRHPAENRTITLIIEDSKGNKIFKKLAKTDQYGIYAADFQLASEVNLGTYKIKAEMEAFSTEKSVNVERYVLPKFKVDLTTTKDFYLPGETLTGDIQSDYFFGKPVAEGKVKITASKFDIGFEQFTVVQGTLDKSGHYTFEFQLPDYFVGLPLENGESFVNLEVSVTDKADHEQIITKTKPVVKSPITLFAVPESGTPVPKVENRIYVLATDPLGNPIKDLTIAMQVEKDNLVRKLNTDALGMVTFALKPDEQRLAFNIKATSDNGVEIERNFEFMAETSAEGILVRSDKSIVNVGTDVTFEVLTPINNGYVYFDLIHEGQTFLTKIIDIAQGKGSFTLTMPPDASGTIIANAYRILRNGDITRDSRVIYVNPINELAINIESDKDVYLPGEDGSLAFTITDEAGNPKAAAIGLQIVDEAVFALVEMQPGLEKIYYTLEKEIMEPRYEIHEIEFDAIILDFHRDMPIDQKAIAEKRADIASATIVPATDFSLQQNTRDDFKASLDETWTPKLDEDLTEILKAFNKYYATHNDFTPIEDSLNSLLDSGWIKPKDLLDPWGTAYRFNFEGFGKIEMVGMTSAGPDEEWNTDDDFEIGPRHIFDINTFRLGRGFGKNGDILMLAAEAMPAPAADGRMFKGQIEEKMDMDASASQATGGGAEPPRIRKYFPETLLFEPALITDGSGKAQLTVKFADSITRWRLSALANALDGSLGSTTDNLRVFQDFFIDIDLPVELTQNDSIAIPVAIFNYLETPQKVRIKVEKADWFKLNSADEFQLDLQAGQVTSIRLPITAEKHGSHSSLVWAYGSQMSDAIERVVSVRPDGKKFEDAVSARLKGNVEQTVNIPKEAIKDASKLLVKLYPGSFSQVVEGLDAIFQMPFGCFEQTSSTTYPNILALDYMRTNEQITPEIAMKAEEYINLGYQRLLTFEVTGGGFEWFGNAPANKMLTAYGLMEFHDMNRVYEIDRNVITRTQNWLVSQQTDDGSWTPDKSFLHAESWGRLQNSNLLVTSYLTWALAESQYIEPPLKKALSYIKAHWDDAEDPYQLAIVANAMVIAEPNDPNTAKVIEKLVSMAKIEGEKAWWESNLETMCYSHGDAAKLEATALAAYALLRSETNASLVDKVLNFILASKDPSGTWYTTQATILALKVFLTAAGKSPDINMDIEVLLDNQKVASVKITPEQSDVMQLIDLGYVSEGSHKVSIKTSGEGEPLYQVTWRFWMPWNLLPPDQSEPLKINVKYDKSKLELNDVVGVSATIENKLPQTVKMVVADLGIPPGFEIATDKLTELVNNKTIQNFELTGRQIIIYIEEIKGNASVKIEYEMTAKMPMKAKTPQSKAYQYYNPEIQDLASPIELEVVEK